MAAEVAKKAGGHHSKAGNTSFSIPAPISHSTQNRSEEHFMVSFRRSWMWLFVFAALVLNQAGAQILAGDDLNKVVPSACFFAGHSAQVQVRNSVGLKNAAGKYVLAGLVDTSGYSTAIQEKYQGFLITEARLSFDGANLEPGQ
jgi:hypothetical protein